MSRQSRLSRNDEEGVSATQIKYLLSEAILLMLGYPTGCFKIQGHGKMKHEKTISTAQVRSRSVVAQQGKNRPAIYSVKGLFDCDGAAVMLLHQSFRRVSDTLKTQVQIPAW